MKSCHKRSETRIYCFIAGCTEVQCNETGMGFCFLLVCGRNDCGLSDGGILEFLCTGISACYCLCTVLPVLEKSIKKEPINGSSFPKIKLSQLYRISSMKYTHKFS